MTSEPPSTIFILNTPLGAQSLASTSLTLSPHWDQFIQSEVQSGRFASASEVVRAALRELEDKNKRLEALRANLAEGADQAARGEFVADFDIERVIAKAKSGA
jgi:antitoxin ParD1/3/4